MNLEVEGVLEVNEEEMEVLAPDWFLESEGKFVVITPTSEYKDVTDSFARGTNVETTNQSVFPLSLEEWQGVNYMNADREHLSSVDNETIEALVPDKVLIVVGDEQRVYRVPDVDSP